MQKSKFSNKHLKIKKSVFALFSALTVDIFDADSNQLELIANMKFNSHMFFYKDKDKKDIYIELMPKSRFANTDYDIIDYENSQKKIATISSSGLSGIISSAKWKINDENGKEMLIFDSENSGGVLKRIADNAVNIYNPSYEYQILSDSHELKAAMTGRLGLFDKEYDLYFKDLSDSEAKIILGIFAVMAILMRK